MNEFELKRICVNVKLLSHVQLFVTPWIVAYQAPPSMEFPRQEYWSGLLFPSPGDLPNPGIKPGSPTLQTDALLSEPPDKLDYDWIWFKKDSWVLLFWNLMTFSGLWKIRTRCLSFKALSLLIKKMDKS